MFASVFSFKTHLKEHEKTYHQRSKEIILAIDTKILRIVIDEDKASCWEPTHAFFNLKFHMVFIERVTVLKDLSNDSGLKLESYVYGLVTWCYRGTRRCAYKPNATRIGEEKLENLCSQFLDCGQGDAHEYRILLRYF